MSDFQDWNPINIGNDNITKQTKAKPEIKPINMNSASNIVKAASTVIEDEDIKRETVDPKFSEQIKAARLGKKMTQAQLAHAMSLDVTIIKDYENGKAKKNGTITSKLKKYLGINKNTV